MKTHSPISNLVSVSLLSILLSACGSSGSQEGTTQNEAPAVTFDSSLIEFPLEEINADQVTPPVDNADGTTPVTNAYNKTVFQRAALNEENVELVTIDALKVVNHVLRTQKQYLNNVTSTAGVTYPVSDFTKVSDINYCDNYGFMEHEFSESEYNFSSGQLLLIEGESAIFSFDMCEANTFGIEAYLSGRKRVEVFKGAYSEDSLEGNEGIVHIQYDALSRYSSTEQLDYVDGELLVSKADNQVQIETHNFAYKDATLLNKGVSYFLDDLDIGITKTDNMLAIFKSYTLDIESMNVHGQTSETQYSVRVTNPVIVNEQRSSALYTGTLEVSSESGLISVNIYGRYSRYTLDVDGDGINEISGMINMHDYE